MTTLSYDPKKWFVYMGNHHEGPFRATEVEAKRKAKLIDSATFVWADGMPDWVPLSEISVFQASRANTSAANSESVDDTDSGSFPELDVDPKEAFLPNATPSLALDQETTPQNCFELETPARIEVNSEPLRQSKLPPPPAHKAKSRSSTWAIWRSATRSAWTLLKLAATAAIAYVVLTGKLSPLLQRPQVKHAIRTGMETLDPLIGKAASQYPAALRVLSPIPDLPDVDPAGLHALRLASFPSYGKAAPHLDIALAKDESGLKPALYVATSLPDGARFEIAAEGIPETLLETLSASADFTAVTYGHLARVELTLPTGSPLPTGNYRIRIAASTDQPAPVKSILESLVPTASASMSRGGDQLALERDLFVGQPKGTVYQATLKEFHSRIRAQASEELTEIWNASQLMEDFLSAATNRRRPARRAGLGPRRGANSLSIDNLNEWLVRWSADGFVSRAYYGNLYILAAQAAQTVLRYDEIESRIARHQGNGTTLEIQLGEAQSVAQSAVLNLRSKVDIAERTASTGELPQREGL